MDIHPSERMVLFIDGPNLHATAKALNFDIDYKKLLSLFGARARLIRAIYYTTVLEQDEFVSIRPLVDWLEYNGYTLATKPAKEYVDSQGRRRLKGSMDVELAVDAMRLSPQMDHAVLFTGDGDFRSLVAALQLQGRRVSVVSTLQAASPMISDDLRRQADQFVDLADLERHVARAPSLRRSAMASERGDDRTGHARDAGYTEVRDETSSSRSERSSAVERDSEPSDVKGGPAAMNERATEQAPARPRGRRPK
jgi:uncharacterized LabA/DUF88 family protein